MSSWEIILEEDRTETRENAIRMLKGELQSPYEFRVIHPDGETRWAMETVRSIEYNGERATLNGQPFHLSNVVHHNMDNPYWTMNSDHTYEFDV